MHFFTFTVQITAKTLAKCLFLCKNDIKYAFFHAILTFCVHFAEFSSLPSAHRGWRSATHLTTS